MFVRALFRDGFDPQMQGLHLRRSMRQFTAEVRPVIAGMENSFLSLDFIYTLIKVPFTHVRMASSGCGERLVACERRASDRRWPPRCTESARWAQDKGSTEARAPHSRGQERPLDRPGKV